MLELIVNSYSIGAVHTMSNNDYTNKNTKNQTPIPQEKDKLNPNSAFELVKRKIFEMYKIHSKNKQKKDK